MADIKTSTLPSILQEYDPKYEPKPITKVRVEEAATIHPDNTQRSKKVKDKDAGRTAAPSLSRETTAEIKRRQDSERNKRTFDFWQKVKRDIREIEIDRLQEKISLQHELLRVQNQQYQQHQEQRRQHEIKKREKEKAERNAKFKALQQVCQESLDKDHQAAKEKRLAERKEKRGKEQEEQLHSAGKSTTATGTQMAEDKKTNKDEEEARTDEQVAPSAPPPVVVSPPANQSRASVSGLHEEVFETLEEEEEDGEEDGGDYTRMNRSSDEALPWHHIQLYELYGKEADYFLHPKIETEAKADVVLNPRLKAVGGRADAGALWDALRYESRMKLVDMDSKLLSPELRSAFSAFAREGLNKHNKPVMRNFYSSEDVPDMTRLMDQSRIRNAQDFRHKVELMFRSSNINQDRTRVLLYNNPPPDLNNFEGTEGIDRYMPSWAVNWDKESELSYKKWLTPRSNDQQQLDYRLPTANSKQDVCEKLPETARGPRLQKAKKTEQSKYVFLTEERAFTPGQFSRRRKEMEETRGCPAAYNTQLPPIQTQKSYSAMAMLGNDGTSSSRSDSVTKPEEKQRKRAQSAMSNHFITQWQPLSLNALLEYKQSHDALGQGEFSHGQKAVWSGVASVTAV